MCNTRHTGERSHETEVEENANGATCIDIARLGDARQKDEIDAEERDGQMDNHGELWRADALEHAVRDTNEDTGNHGEKTANVGEHRENESVLVRQRRAQRRIPAGQNRKRRHVAASWTAVLLMKQLGTATDGASFDLGTAGARD